MDCNIVTSPKGKMESLKLCENLHGYDLVASFHFFSQITNPTTNL